MLGGGEGLWGRENQIDIISNTDDKNRCSRATFKKIKEKWSPATSNINLIQFSEKKLLVLRKKTVNFLKRICILILYILKC